MGGIEKIEKALPSLSSLTVVTQHPSRRKGAIPFVIVCKHLRPVESWLSGNKEAYVNQEIEQHPANENSRLYPPPLPEEIEKDAGDD